MNVYLCKCDQGVPEKEHCSQQTPLNKWVHVVEQVELNQRHCLRVCLVFIKWGCVGHIVRVVPTVTGPQFVTVVLS